MNEINFTDKVAIITGASSGIGAEIAITFAELNAKLTLVGRDQQRLKNTAAKCTSKRNLTPLCLQLDLTEQGSCEIVVNETLKTYGKIDILINSAGKFILSSLHDKSIAIFEELMNINFRVPFYLAQLSLPHLKKTKGNIVNIGSSLSKGSRPGFLSYIVSKAALSMLGKLSSEELASDGVRINTISPGATRTNIMSNLDINNENQSLFYQFIETSLPSRKVMEPHDVARLVCVVASDMFPNVTGADIFMDGAVSMM